jgi:hypothetical protein
MLDTTAAPYVYDRKFPGAPALLSDRGRDLVPFLIAGQGRELRGL